MGDNRISCRCMMCGEGGCGGGDDGCGGGDDGGGGGCGGGGGKGDGQ